MLSSSSSRFRAPLLSLRCQSRLPLSTTSSARVLNHHGRPTPRPFSSKPTFSTRHLGVRCPGSNSSALVLTRSMSSDPTSSTTINPTTPSTPSQSTSESIRPTPSSPPTTSLNWNDYLSLRRSRRRYNLVSSLCTSICSTAAGATAVQQNFEQVGGMFGLDPFFTAIIAIVASAGAGWLTGPILGTAVFNLLHGNVKEEMAAKEKDFYRRIKRLRVDPSRQSMQNPLPDYYGEKIGSVAEFRTWMKDQRAYNRKRFL